MGFEIINKIKKEKGLTNQQISVLSGITLSTLDKITSGVNTNPKLDTLQALCRVLGCTLDDFSDISKTKIAPSLSDEAIQLANDYDVLDVPGKKQIRTVADNELQRVRDIRREKQRTEEIVYFTVWEQQLPMSAGTGEPADEEQVETLRLIKEPPRGTSCVARVSGDSMEPTYRDGDRVFIKAQEQIRLGQIGVFFMDGKQWIKELGDGELISHNPEFGPRPLTEDIRCQGLVLGVCDESYFE